MSLPRYEKKWGSYYLKDNGVILHMSDEVAIGFSWLEDGSTILHKHGRREFVESWLLETKTKYDHTGLFGESAGLCMICPEDWDVEELNKILDTTGYLSVFLRNQGIGREMLLDSN